MTIHRPGWSERIGRRIKLRDLHVLMAVVQAGSMARAAEHLAVSQPVVSKVIADLEHALGVRLLDRDRRGAEPTIYGQALLRRGIAAFDELRLGVQEVESLLDPGAGELRIAAADPMAAGVIPAVIDRISRIHPRVVFHIAGGASLLAQQCEALRARRIDLIVGRLPQPFSEPDLDIEVLCEEPTLVAADARNKWAGKRRVKLADLIDEPWVLPDAGSFVGSIVAAWFRQHGFDLPARRVFGTSIQLNNALLATGRYLAFYPASVIRLNGKRLAIKVLPLDVPPRSTPVGVVALKGRMPTPVMRLFIEHAREVMSPARSR